MKNCYHKLEYDKILQILSNYCKTDIGKDISLNLEPSNNKLVVKHLQAETTEAVNLVAKLGNSPIYFLPNINLWLKYLEGGNSLSAKALLEIGKTLKLSRELKNYFFDNKEIELNSFPILLDKFNLLYTNTQIENVIFKSIIDENTISDDASSTLSSLRRKRKRLEQDVKDKLNSIIHSSNYSKYIMESIVTIRNDRYVIPVKIEYKDNIKGFVHDISSSGSTVFIEPMTIFELNTKISNLKIEENLEIEKILKNISTSLFPIYENIKEDTLLIGELDFIFAKSIYSKNISGIEPHINENKLINLYKARHPLIDKSKVVPIDITLGKDYNSLIITGPNTGGKTITLKTVGLLTLMAESGLHIPANENSSIFVFDKIFASIGDEQSIQESLSTFSSHMLNIIEILNSFNTNSLVLLDELGSGTDPVEGSSLAISILEYLYKNGAITLSTTHYPEIKNYALVTDGFENASCEFDIENLRPTYKLLVGIPGKSNAFAISKRLGLQDDILNRANNLLTNDHINIEELLKSIYDNKLQIEKEKELIDKNLNQVQVLRKSLETDLSIHKQKEKEIVEKAKEEARQILLNAKSQANDIIKELNELPESIDSLKEANNLRNELNSSLKNYAPKLSETASGNLNPKDIKIGMKVLVKSLNTKATILSLPNKSNEVQLQIGNAKMMMNINKIEKVDSDTQDINKSNITLNKKINLKTKTISSEINVIGQNVDEAVFVIDKYLDDCSLAKISPIRIVHGKGTGKLRARYSCFFKNTSTC